MEVMIVLTMRRCAVPALVVLLVLAGAATRAQERRDPATPEVLPAPDFATNFCAFPRAWTISNGSGVSVLVVRSEPSPKWDWRAQIAALAPGATVAVEPMENWLEGRLSRGSNTIVLIAQAPAAEEFERAVAAIALLARKGVPVILPAYFGPMASGEDRSAWQGFVRQASAAGAIVVGLHGRAYQLGMLEYWKALPVDVYALHRGVDGGSYTFADSAIDREMAEPAAYVAAAAALLRGSQPGLKPSEVRDAFRQRGRRVYWMAARWASASRVRVLPMLDPEGWKANAELRAATPEVIDRLEGECLDAARLLGLPGQAPGEWALSALNVATARKRATGKGVTVAILDHLFDPEDASLKERLVAPGCVVEGEPVFSVAGHGTWMARELLKVAPGARIMPVRFLAGEAYRAKDLTDYYVKGIDYAVRHRADVISLSHPAVPKERQGDLDAAIERAAAAGVTFVYIHYQGTRDDVVKTGMVEFAPFDQGRASVYVVGTGFVDAASFPHTWGMSQTAPLVAGVIAMMKELNPKLGPREVRRILLESGRGLPSGYRLLDAAIALERAAAAR